MTATVAARPPVRALNSPALAIPLALALSGVFALSAHAQIPFWPVPLTLQPLAVLLVAAFAGPRVAVGAYAAYLVEGALGLPVFAGTPARGIGLAYMAGPTGGYLAGQFAATVLISLAIDRLRPALRPALLLGGLVAIYALGAAWLATFVGAEKVWALGVLPFLLGDAVKLGIASAAVLLRARI